MAHDPAWLIRARAELGVHETPGPVSTKRVLNYRAMADMRLGGDDGVVPWCSIFVGAMLRAAGLPTEGANAMARSWLHWGQPIDWPAPGAVVVLRSAIRPEPAGHVTFATGRVTSTHIEGVGGNQRDAVSAAMFALKDKRGQSMVLGYRWPKGVPLPAGKPAVLAINAPSAAVKDV